MIQSMTGFGKGEATISGYTANAEIRSVNSRYLEINVKLPQSLSAREIEVRELIRQRIGRGKVSLLIYSSGVQETPDLAVDEDSVVRIKGLLNAVRKAANIRTPVKLEHLLIFKDLFRGTTTEIAEEGEWVAAKVAVTAAVDQLRTSRKAEGEALMTDLNGRIINLETLLERIEALSRSRTLEEKSRLRQKVSEILNGKEVDPARLELEIVLLADKLDITEEVVRFKTHDKFFKELLEAQESSGRRLNFLLQEMNREANTMGSKAFDAEMSHLVVEIKEELEKIREQVQNLE